MALTAKVLVLTVAFFAFAEAIFERKTLQIDRFLGVCPGYKNLTMQLYDIRIRNVNRDFSMSLKCRVLKDTSSDLKMKMVFSRCKSKEALDSCEPASDVNFSQVCAIVNTKMPPFKASLELIQPKITCPFKKGVYELANFAPDQTTLSMFPLAGWYLRGHIYFLDNIEGDYKIISCYYMEGALVVVK